jgi:hypothetical protein
METSVQFYTPAVLHPRKGPPLPSTHRIGAWVVPITNVDYTGKRKILPAGNRTLAVHPIARRYTD